MLHATAAITMHHIQIMVDRRRSMVGEEVCEIGTRFNV
jgi:hypothetical protein